MLSVICNLMFPKNSVTEISDVNLGDKHHNLNTLYLLISLGDISFPVLFQLCLAELKSKGDKYQRFGYKDEEHMYLGQSLYNDTVFGWAGHRNNGSHFSVAGRVIKIINIYKISQYTI